VVFKLFGWPVEENIKYKDFDSFYENTSETCSISQIKILFRLMISVFGQFSPRDHLLLDRGKVGLNTHYTCHGGFTEQFLDSQPGSGASFAVTGGGF
jgi:hypothetical protein